MSGIKYLLILFFISTQCAVAERNVILIIADDLGTDYFGFYKDHVDTVDVPNIRSLARNGVRFNHLMSNPVCSSTRSTILTGRYSFRTGVGGIVGGIGGSNQLDTSEKTIPRLLKIYNPLIACADIGKWHLHQPMPISHLLYPNRLGYDHYEGPFIGQLPSYTNWTKYINGNAVNVTNYATVENVNNALSWLKTISVNRPFFLWLAFNAPHEPLHLPPTGLHSYTNLTGSMQDINSNPKSYFKAMIQAMDHEIGRLFDSLKTMNRFDSTDVIFIGDNGNTQRTAQITNLAKAKGTIYEYGTHVPMLVSGPSVVAPNRYSDALINTTDIFSTILELMGDTGWKSAIPQNKIVDGKSFLSILKNQNAGIRPWSFSELFKLITDSADGKAIRNIDYKLIKFDNGKNEFYNLLSDSSESNNLLSSNMNTQDISNYNYLCNELANLTGTSTVNCQIAGLNDSNANSTFYFVPNPFFDKITLSQKLLNSHVVLLDALGKVVYSGNEIEKHDFSNQPKGLYFLVIKENLITHSFKLIHQ